VQVAGDKAFSKKQANKAKKRALFSTLTVHFMQVPFLAAERLLRKTRRYKLHYKSLKDAP
jgi:hypothetical protein